MDPITAMICPVCGVVTPTAHDCDPLLVVSHELRSRWEPTPGAFWRSQVAS